MVWRFVGARALLLGCAGVLALGIGVQETGPSLTIVTPEAGATIDGPDVTVTLRAGGVVLGGQERTGAYVLLRIDSRPPVKCYTDRFTFQGTTEGEHRLRAELRRRDGARFDPPVRHQVRFSVRGSTG